MHMLLLCMQRQDLPPGDPGNAAPGFAKVLVRRKNLRQENRADPICREGSRKAVLFKSKPQA